MGPPDGMVMNGDQTQVDTQVTNESPAYVLEEENDEIWASLIPGNDVLQRIDFWKTTSVYRVGRNPGQNQIVFPGPKVSNQHCTISWDGQVTVTVHDTSTNGTYVSGFSWTIKRIY
jgi:ser/thr/tyr protein kinase RAD53